MNGSSCRIRLETPADYRKVENLTREAFWNVYRPGCTERLWQGSFGVFNGKSG
ncbi:MAG: acetyltransferase [Lachnospiraceae bacterium]|uniref:acetyltransferase n=1 Tax=Candidatus Merdisoma sp. JLR.KK006 TaxID=3112626 RepID=UPI002FF36010|nr:acetyltransferase [Lachnospiraceae bacterium]